MEPNSIQLNICYGCMRLLGGGVSICPHCGYDSSVLHNPVYALPEGTVLYGKYLIGKTLGRNSLGITYLGYDLLLQVKTVIKEYFPAGNCFRSSKAYDVISESFHKQEGSFDFAEGYTAFLNDACTLSHVNSPHFINIRDCFREHNTAYVVDDYVEGISLYKEMQKCGGKIEAERVLSLMKPLILEMGRQFEGVYSDLKIDPYNILLVKEDSSEYIRLSDFGQSTIKSMMDPRDSGSFYNSLFLSIEHYSKQMEKGPWTDVYSLCVMIYYMLTGQAPTSALECRLGVPIKTFHECGVEVSEQIEKAIMHGLASKSDDRIQTMQQLYDELTDCSKGVKTEEKQNLLTKKKWGTGAVIWFILMILAQWILFAEYITKPITAFNSTYQRLTILYGISGLIGTALYLWLIIGKKKTPAIIILILGILNTLSSFMDGGGVSALPGLITPVITYLVARGIETADPLSTPEKALPQIVLLTVDVNPSTPFRWRVSQSEELFEYETHYIQEEGPPGTSGKETYRFTPKHAGTVKVALACTNICEVEKPEYLYVYKFAIDKDLRVRLLDAQNQGTAESANIPQPEIR